MGLILDRTHWSPEQLRKQLAELREEMQEMHEMFSAPPPTIVNPWPFEFGAKAAAEAMALADAVLATPGATDELVGGAVNLFYETRNLFPYLIRASRVPAPPFPSRKSK